MDTKILLENGTNELEVLEFILDGNSYGINVAKIKEIITYQPVTPVPNAHPSIEGIFMPRDTMITAIDLKNCLGRNPSTEGGLFIITNFNKLDIAFHVDDVKGIHRGEILLNPTLQFPHPRIAWQRVLLRRIPSLLLFLTSRRL